MNNGGRCLCAAQPGTNKWRNPPAEQRSITNKNQKPIERFGVGGGEENTALPNTVDFFNNSACLFIYFLTCCFLI